MFGIAALPAQLQQMPRWKVAAQALMPVVDAGGPTMLARIGMMQALKSDKSEPQEPRKKRRRHTR